MRVADDAPCAACYSKIDMQGEVSWNVMSCEIIVGMTKLKVISVVVKGLACGKISIYGGVVT